MKISAVSDTHFPTYPWENIPDCDVLLHCGDATMGGEIEEWEGFFAAMNMLLTSGKVKNIIYVPGNHDFGSRNAMKTHASIRNLINSKQFFYCENDYVIIDGVVFYGFCKESRMDGWEHYIPYQQLLLEIETRPLPPKTDVLITHVPAYGILDDYAETSAFYPLEDSRGGCKAISELVKRLNPKYHLFGHVHEDGGKRMGIGNTTFYNVAGLMRDYETQIKIRSFLI